MIRKPTLDSPSPSRSVKSIEPPVETTEVNWFTASSISLMLPTACSDKRFATMSIASSAVGSSRIAPPEVIDTSFCEVNRDDDKRRFVANAVASAVVAA